MADETFEQLNKLGSSTYASFRALIGINEKALQRLARAQQDLYSQSLEAGAEQLTLAGNAKSVQDVMAGQSKLISAQTEKLVNYARTTAQILKETQEELEAWVKETTRSALVNIKVS